MANKIWNYVAGLPNWVILAAILGITIAFWSAILPLIF